MHQRGRLGILTVLAAKNRADFSYLQTALDMTRGNLGKHLEALADASLVSFTSRRDMSTGEHERGSASPNRDDEPSPSRCQRCVTCIINMNDPTSTRTPRDPCMCEHGALNSKSLIADGRPHPDRDRTWAGSGDIHRSST